MPTEAKLMKRPLPLAATNYLADTPEARLRFAAATAMAATLVHEVNQPLTAAANSLSACARRLRSRGDGNADVLAMLDHATQETLKAGEIIRRTRNFVVTGRISAERENLRTMVERAILMLGDRRDAVGITTEVPLDLFVRADRLQIEQALATLLQDACAALEGRADGWIEFEAKRAGETILLTIADNRLGLAASAANDEDPDFGLAIAALIVEAHRGRLSSANGREGGARFTLALPGAD